MKPLRLIFLDIDGVVNSMEYEMYCEDIREGKVEGVTEVPKNEKVEMIRELCEKFEVFRDLKTIKGLFEQVKIEPKGYALAGIPVLTLVLMRFILAV